MKDLIGQKLELGDTVVFNDKQYSNICIGTVAQFTPKNVWVREFISHKPSWTALCKQDQVLKINAIKETTPEYFM